ncbi:MULTISPECIES: disulfide bond formation protein B [unclassified Haladaptatus]|uniref:disulfide bond formation protein B n=1 Tax=unclassified Haladaptatus TaxID=2622732 RepID=UPI0023E87ED5|nr:MULTISPECIES: disulfide bond formation protein B [unclassified Haladaptatus]
MAATELRAKHLLAAATAVATVATVGSLYLSLGLGLVPCELCWYQRILMYPLVVILGVATLESRVEVFKMVLPLSVLGLGIAAYHSYIQLVPTAAVTSCSFDAGGSSCSAVLFKVAGLTVPNLSLIAFVLITGLVVAALRR